MCSALATSLEWLISPVSKKSFFQDFWEKKPLVVSHAQRHYFEPLFSLDEADRVLTTLDRRYPDVTLKNANREITGDDYTVGDDALDVAKVFQLFREGSTIAFAYLDTVVPSLTSFRRSLESEFSCLCQTNVYLTPPAAQGARPHYDTHDVFVMQIAGSKHWTLYGTPVESPLAAQDFDPAIHEQGAPTQEFELKAGDVAYIPRGVVHDARSSDNISLHITAGILRTTWTDLLLEFVAEASLNDPAFRKSLPPGFARADFDRGQARATFRHLLQQLSAKANFEAILDRFADEFVSACPPLLRGQMAQLAALDRLTIDSKVGARAGVISRVRSDVGESASVECYGRKIIFPAHAREALRFALSNSEFVVRSLPGGLDDAGKLALVRRLIREGLMVALST